MISDSLLLFFQGESTKQDDEEGEKAAARCAPRDDRREWGKLLHAARKDRFLSDVAF